MIKIETQEKIKSYIKMVIKYFLRILKLLPIHNNRILLFSYTGKQYSCNPKYLTKYILANEEKEKFDIIWVFDKKKKIDELSDVKIVKKNSLRYFYYLSTAKVIITNTRTSELFEKRKKQFYIQTWHSSLRLKKIEKDAENTLTSKYIREAKEDSKKCDLLISGCEYSTSILKRAFWYNGNILECGTPRNDVFFNNNLVNTEKIKERIGIESGKKIFLYAPTFRKEKDISIYDLNFEEIQKSLKSRFGYDWTILIRLHPVMIDEAKKLTKKNVIDITWYDDIQELLCITDILVTDYSSLMFDFLLTEKPCFLYASDLQSYTTNDRGLYFKFEDLPFSFSETTEKLSKEIINFDEEKYKIDVQNFKRYIGNKEKGNACKEVIDIITKMCFEEKYNER